MNDDFLDTFVTVFFGVLIAFVIVMIILWL